MDGSPESFEALRQAITLRPPEGELLAMVVVDLGVAVRTGFQAVRTARRLEDEAAAARELVGEAVQGVPFSSASVVRGRPAPSLRAAARRRHADVLVVGSHGLSRRVGILVGSVASELLHKAPCSVLLSRPTVDGAQWAPREIVVGVDGSACSLEALSVARSIAARFDEARVEARLCAGARSPEVSDLDGATVMRDERAPVDALVAASETADLLVVGSRGLQGLAALGSVSERVAHRATCSVLVVRG